MSGNTASAVSKPASALGGRACVALSVLQVVLALFLGIARAFPKLITLSSAAGTFDELGRGSAGMYTIGALELAGGVALLIPLLQSVAAMALIALMVGAFVVQVTVFDGEYAAPPVVLILPPALTAWARRGHNGELLRLLGVSR